MSDQKIESMIESKLDEAIYDAHKYVEDLMLRGTEDDKISACTGAMAAFQLCLRRSNGYDKEMLCNRSFRQFMFKHYNMNPCND